MNVRVIERESSDRTVLYTSIVKVTIYKHVVVTTDKNGVVEGFDIERIRSIEVDNDGAVT